MEQVKNEAKEDWICAEWLIPSVRLSLLLNQNCPQSHGSRAIGLPGQHMCAQTMESIACN
jgi:hypothetical protein